MQIIMNCTENIVIQNSLSETPHHNPAGSCAKHQKTPQGMKCAGKAVSYKSRQFLVIFLCFYDIVTVYQERFWPSQKDYKMAKCTSLKKVYAKDRTVTKYWDPHEVTAWGIHKNYNSYRLIKVFWTIAGSCRRSVLFSIWNRTWK